MPQIAHPAADRDKDDLPIGGYAYPAVAKRVVPGNAERSLKVELRQHFPRRCAVSPHIGGAGDREKHRIRGGMERRSDRLRAGIDTDVGDLIECAVVNQGAVVSWKGKQGTISAGPAFIIEMTGTTRPGNGAGGDIVEVHFSARNVTFSNDYSSAVAAAAHHAVLPYGGDRRHGAAGGVVPAQRYPAGTGETGTDQRRAVSPIGDGKRTLLAICDREEYLVGLARIEINHVDPHIR